MRRRPEAPPPEKIGFLTWLKKLFSGGPRTTGTRAQQELRALEEFQQHFRVPFGDIDLLKLALTHRSYLSVTGQGPRESNERLEFLGDSVLGLVTSEYLYRENPQEHEGDLTKSKSLLVSKAILSRRALAMGLGRFVLMSHSEVESGGRQRLSILADAFEAVIGAIYLDQGFEPAREFIHKWLLRESSAIVADKRHTNYKSHLQEYVQSTWRTHPVYRIRSEMGPDHSKHFLVEVLVGKRSLGEGRGRNKKEAEQAAARSALERAGVMSVGNGEDDPIEERPIEPRRVEPRRPEPEAEAGVSVEEAAESDPRSRRRERRRRGGRGREEADAGTVAPIIERPERPAEPTGRLATPSRRLEPLPERPAPEPILPEKEPPPLHFDEDEEVGRPEGPFEALHVDPFAWGSEPPAPARAAWPDVEPAEEIVEEQEPAASDEPAPRSERTSEREPRASRRESVPAEPTAPPGAAREEETERRRPSEPDTERREPPRAETTPHESQPPQFGRRRSRR